MVGDSLWGGSSDDVHGADFCSLRAIWTLCWIRTEGHPVSDAIDDLRLHSLDSQASPTRMPRLGRNVVGAKVDGVLDVGIVYIVHVPESAGYGRPRRVGR